MLPSVALGPTDGSATVISGCVSCKVSIFPLLQSSVLASWHLFVGMSDSLSSTFISHFFVCHRGLAPSLPEVQRSFCLLALGFYFPRLDLSHTQTERSEYQRSRLKDVHYTTVSDITHVETTLLWGLPAIFHLFAEF